MADDTDATPTLNTGNAGTQQAAFVPNIDAIDNGVGETTEAAISAGIVGDTADGTASVRNFSAADGGNAATTADAFSAENSSDGDGPSVADSGSGETTDSGIPTGNADSDVDTKARRRVATYWIVGLGLILGYAVTRGSTWIESQPGESTTVQFSIPTQGDDSHASD